MEVEQTTAGGVEKGVEGGALCFGPMDGVQEEMGPEMLETLWSELDGFGGGVLNGLLSSDIHDGGPVPEMDVHEHGHEPGPADEEFKLLGVKEEFPLHGGAPETSRAEIDAQAASLAGSVNIHDYFAIKDLPHHTAEANPYGLTSLPDSHENLGFHSSSYEVKDELLNGSAGPENSNSIVDGGLQMPEQFLLQANMVDDVPTGLAVVGRSNTILEGPVSFNELHTMELAGKQNEDSSHGIISSDVITVTHKFGETQEEARGSSAIPAAGSNPAEEGIDRVGGNSFVKEAENEHRVKQEDELHGTQIFHEEGDDMPDGVRLEVLGFADAMSRDRVVKLEEEAAGGAKLNAEINSTKDVKRVEAGGGMGEVAIKILAEQEEVPDESDVLGSEVDDEGIESEDDEEISFDGDSAVAGDSLPKIGPVFMSEMLVDGSISVEGLASKGFVVISDDEEADCEEATDDSSDEEDEELEEAFSLAVSESEDGAGTVDKAKPAAKGKEEGKDLVDEAGAPRTKHELDVLPPVPKVTAVLQPHHKTVSVGLISTVLDLKVVVESSGTERILNENSIIWLTQSRVPLGVVDEVFGPVKHPLYVVRFNEPADIPEDAKAGADVSYVSEFSEFVLKENPSLYRRGVDASGLDDEELGSEEDLEFSDDEKEAAARMREKSKRTLDHREDRQGGPDWKSANGQHSKGQRTERGRGGRGRGGGRGAVAADAVDSAAEFVADMDLQSASPWRSPRPPGNNSQQNGGRRWTRGRQNSSRNSGHQEFSRGSRAPGPADGQRGGSRAGSADGGQRGGSRSGPADGQRGGSRSGLADGQKRSSPQQQHQESPQRREGLYFPEQANRQPNRQMFAEQANRQMLAQQANRQMLAESANRQMLAQQANQTGGGGMQQGIQFNAGSIPPHLQQGQGVLRQQQPGPAAGFQAYGYPQVPTYDARQGSVHSVPVGPQLIQNPVVFSSPNLPPNPYFNNQGQGQMNMIHNPGYGNIVHPGQMNFGVPVNRSLGDTQTGVHPSLLGGGSVVALDHRNSSMPQNSHQNSQNLQNLQSLQSLQNLHNHQNHPQNLHNHQNHPQNHQSQGPQWFGPNKYYK